MFIFSFTLSCTQYHCICWEVWPIRFVSTSFHSLFSISPPVYLLWRDVGIVFSFNSCHGEKEMKARLMAHEQLPGRWIDGWLDRGIRWMTWRFDWMDEWGDDHQACKIRACSSTYYVAAEAEVRTCVFLYVGISASVCVALDLSLNRND